MNQIINIENKKENLDHKNQKIIKKTNSSSIEEYIDYLYLKGEKHIPYVKNPAKIKDEDVTTPTIDNYTILVEYNYNTHYVLRTGFKNELKMGVVLVIELYYYLNYFFLFCIILICHCYVVPSQFSIIRL